MGAERVARDHGRRSRRGGAGRAPSRPAAGAARRLGGRPADPAGRRSAGRPRAPEPPRSHARRNGSGRRSLRRAPACLRARDRAARRSRHVLAEQPAQPADRAGCARATEVRGRRPPAQGAFAGDARPRAARSLRAALRRRPRILSRHRARGRQPDADGRGLAARLPARSVHHRGRDARADPRGPGPEHGARRETGARLSLLHVGPGRGARARAADALRLRRLRPHARESRRSERRALRAERPGGQLDGLRAPAPRPAPRRFRRHRRVLGVPARDGRLPAGRESRLSGRARTLESRHRLPLARAAQPRRALQTRAGPRREPSGSAFARDRGCAVDLARELRLPRGLAGEPLRGPRRRGPRPLHALRLRAPSRPAPFSRGGPRNGPLRQFRSPPARARRSGRARSDRARSAQHLPRDLPRGGTLMSASSELGLWDLPRVVLPPEQEALLAGIDHALQGSPSWQRRKKAEIRDLLALATLAPRLEVVAIDPRTALLARLVLRVPVPFRLPGMHDLAIAQRAHLVLRYPEEALRMPQPGYAFVEIERPLEVFHPNVGGPLTPAGGMLRGGPQLLCLGAHVAAGTPVRELVLATYQALGMMAYHVDPASGAGVMNREAAAWWAANLARVPLTREPFLDGGEA